MMPEETQVRDPAEIEQRIEQASDRIARGVGIVMVADREARRLRREFDLAYARAYVTAAGAPAHERKFIADIESMPQREAAEDAELAYRHAERQMKAIEKELLAWQSIGNSVRAMYGAVR